MSGITIEEFRAQFGDAFLPLVQRFLDDCHDIGIPKDIVMALEAPFVRFLEGVTPLMVNSVIEVITP